MQQKEKDINILKMKQQNDEQKAKDISTELQKLSQSLLTSSSELDKEVTIYVAHWLSSLFIFDVWVSFVKQKALTHAKEKEMAHSSKNVKSRQQEIKDLLRQCQQTADKIDCREKAIHNIGIVFFSSG